MQCKNKLLFLMSVVMLVWVTHSDDVDDDDAVGVFFHAWQLKFDYLFNIIFILPPSQKNLEKTENKSEKDCQTHAIFLHFLNFL